jgi:ParB/RepB/Spo0J family partition protein
MAHTAGEITLIPVSQLRPGDNDRTAFNEVALRELADSIAANGLAQPITVRPIWTCPACKTEIPATFPDDPCPGCGDDPIWQDLHYQIVAGERRFRVCSGILGWSEIPAIVRDLGDEQAAAVMLAENVHRVDLNPLDEARAYWKRMAQFGWSVAETARQANVGEGRVANRLKLLDLAPEIQHLVANGHLGLGFAQAMGKLDRNRQRIALAWLREQPATPTLNIFNRVVGELYEQQAQEAMFDLAALLRPQVVAAVEGSESSRLHELLPTLPGLPDLPTRLGGIGRLIDDYVAELLACGQAQAARVLMDFWVKAMRANYAQVNAFESKALAALVK